MKFQHSTLFILALVNALSLEAIHPILNPLSWYKGIKNVYKARTQQASSLAIKQAQLQNLYQIRNEIDNLSKIHRATQAGQFETSWEHWLSKQARNRDAQQIHKAFGTITNKCYPLIRNCKSIPAFTEKLEQTIADTQNELGIKPTTTSISWHRTLEAQVAQLPTEEFHKSSEIRKQEFLDWQKNYKRKWFVKPSTINAELSDENLAEKTTVQARRKAEFKVWQKKDPRSFQNKFPKSMA